MFGVTSKRGNRRMRLHRSSESSVSNFRLTLLCVEIRFLSVTRTTSRTKRFASTDTPEAVSDSIATSHRPVLHGKDLTVAVPNADHLE